MRKEKLVMDKREGLRAGIAEMRTVAQRLNQWADDLEASFRGQEAPEREVPPAEPVQPGKRKKAEEGKKSTGSTEAAGAVEPEPEAKPLTLPEVRAILAGKCAAGFGTQVKALIESYGASSLKGVPPEKYEELLEAVAPLGAEDGDQDAG
jgi:hypothetical protein